MSFNSKKNEEICDWCERFSILLQNRINDMMKNNLFTKDFPESCPDNELPCGCNMEEMKKVFFGEIGLDYDETIHNNEEKPIIRLI